MTTPITLRNDCKDDFDAEVGHLVSILSPPFGVMVVSQVSRDLFGAVEFITGTGQGFIGQPPTSFDQASNITKIIDKFVADGSAERDGEINNV